MRQVINEMSSPRALVFYGGFRRRGGGAYRHAEAIEKELTRAGWKVSVITLDTLPAIVRFLPHVVEKAINLVAMPLGFHYKGRITRLLYKYFIRESADFYLFEDIYLSWNVMAPAVTMLHAVWSDNLQSFEVSERQTQRLISREVAIIAQIDHPVATVSEPYRDYLEKEYFTHAPLKRQMAVVELGLDLHEFPTNLNPASGRALIYCGALEARKNLLFLLEVFELVIAKDPSATLTIIGDGPEAGNLESYALLRDLKVTFKGRLSHEQVIEELVKHSIYLHTSVKESFSFSLLEAKLCGLTTCASAKLEVPEVFIDEGFECFDACEWATRILGINNSPDLREFPDFSAARMASRTLQLAGLNETPELALGNQ